MLVESIPPGHVMSYGGIAHVLGQGGARQVARVMSYDGGGVPWWRVVRADGTLPERLRGRALEHYRAEGTRLRGGADRATLRVDMAAAGWEPPRGWPPCCVLQGGRLRVLRDV